MSKLTEGMVIARTRATDLQNVKKLNCWGSELSDVSLLRKMSNVEVLSLSVNNISSLADFQFCHNLQELYIRKNQIKNITEICYLKELAKLKNLWLEDNPCAIGDKYRLTVLKMLPQLQKLDNISVQPEELREATLYGLELTHPDDKNKNENNSLSSSSSSSISPPSLRFDIDQNNLRCITEEYDAYNSNPTPVSQEINRREDIYQKELADRELERRVQQQKQEEYQKRLQAQRDEDYRREMERRAQQEEQTRRTQSQQAQYELDIPTSKESNGQVVSGSSESNNNDSGRAGALFGSYRESNTYSQGSNRPSSNPLPDCNAMYQSKPYAVQNHPEGPEENANMQQSFSQESHHTSVTSCNYSSAPNRQSPTRPYPVRPKTRNSNILSAVLCLIKELDYANLEVVEMAVRCRMDELDD